MSSHGSAPPTPGATARVPEPTPAERARTLTHQGLTGTLATLSRQQAGYPFASIMPYALDTAGAPLFLISSMAVHTQNLQADPRASLLVVQPDWVGDPLAGGRVTLMGETHRVDPAEIGAARAAYLARHERARHWIEYQDFSLWRLVVNAVYWVGGFAAMGWIAPHEYAAAHPDPLADQAADIVSHMNRDHRDALLTLAHYFAAEEADEATMVAVDRLGFKLRLRRGEGVSSARIGFPAEVRTAAATREAVTTLLQIARAARQRGT